MKPFNPPDPELRERLMRDVDFKQRLTAGQLHQRAGVESVDLYSLDDLYILLNSPCPMIDVADIARWCREVLQDPGLAERIEAAAARETNERNRLLHVRSLVEQRLLQCREAAQAD